MQTELPQNWPHRASSRFVTAAGIRWHCQLVAPESPELPESPGLRESRDSRDSPNRPPTVLLLHGTGGSTHQWADVLPALAQHATVIAPDLPGHGFSLRVGGDLAEPDPLSLPGMARAVAALLAQLERRPDVIVGHSAGAAVALRMTLDGLVAPEAVVGFNPALIPPPDLWVDLLAPLASGLVKAGWLARTAAWVAGNGGVVRKMLESSGATLTDQQLTYYMSLFRDPDHCAAALGMMSRWNLPALVRDAAGLRVPFTAYAGARDQWVPTRELETQLRRIPGASLVEVPEVGHLLPEEAPQTAVAAVLRALQRGAPAPL